MNKFDLQEIKRTLGDIQILDYRGLDIIDAHKKLGEEVHDQITRILDNRNSDMDEFTRQVRFAQQILENLEEKSKSASVHVLIQEAIRTYLKCIRSWAHGADLEIWIANQGWSHLVSPEQLAIMLQNDNTGCQTGVLRQAAGGILIWHTEEDDELEEDKRFDKLRLVIFQCEVADKPVDIYSFIYPDLLPGSAFNWRSDGYLQVVDSLYLEQDETASMLANSICWLRLVLDTDISTQMLLEALGPIADGYALSIAFSSNDAIVAETSEFTRDQYVFSILPDVENSFLFQVNMFSDAVPESLKQFENISSEEKTGYLYRQERTVRYLGEPSYSKSITDIRNLLSSTTGGPYCYASPWVKSYLFASLDDKELKVWLGAGPASTSDKLHHFVYDLRGDKS